MRPSVDLKSSYLENLELRGVTSGEDGVYLRVLVELSEFMDGHDPCEWTRDDFEAFLKSRAHDLSPHEVAAYGIGLGVLTEIIEKSVARDMRLDLELDVVLKTASQLPTIAHDDTMLPPGANAAQSTSEIEIESLDNQDDFLAENLEDWRRKTGRGDGDSSNNSHNRRRTSPNLEALGARRGVTPDIRVQWVDDGRYIHVAWSGFVEGPTLRSAFGSGLKLQSSHRATRWLVDMAGASVLSERDSEWFADWLLNAQKTGVRKFAVVEPENAIARMQLRRLRELNEASSLELDGVKRAKIAVFNALTEAEGWLGDG